MTTPATPPKWATLPILKAFAPPPPRTTTVSDAAQAAGELPPGTLPGPSLRTRAGAAKRGHYAPVLRGSPSTTRQARILNAALLAPPTGTEGIVQGRDVTSRNILAHDPHTAYHRTRAVTSLNVGIFGNVGSGKSSLTKTCYVTRPLTLERRRAVVFDRKNRGGEGEYAELSRAYGSDPLTFGLTHDTARLNLLDPTLAGALGIRGTRMLLRTLMQLARQRPGHSGELSAFESKALRAGLQLALERADQRVPVLSDLLPCLGAVADTPAADGLSPQALDELHQGGLRLRYTLEEVLDDMGPLLDGETSSNIDLSGKLTSFDLSQLPHDGPSSAIVMAIGHVWLNERLRGDKGWATNAIYEEGWALTQGPIAELVRANQKLSRGLALSNVFVFHKISDIPEDSPALTILQEAQTVHVFRQEAAADAAAAVDRFGLDSASVSTIQTLAPGHCLLKISGRPEIHMQHVRAEWERQITDTDEAVRAAMRGA